MDFEDIQTIAEKTYRENIAYLQKEQATLFAKLQLLTQHFLRAYTKKSMSFFMNMVILM